MKNNKMEVENMMEIRGTSVTEAVFAGFAAGFVFATIMCLMILFAVLSDKIH